MTLCGPSSTCPSRERKRALYHRQPCAHKQAADGHLWPSCVSPPTPTSKSPFPVRAATQGMGRSGYPLGMPMSTPVGRPAPAPYVALEQRRGACSSNGGAWQDPQGTSNHVPIRGIPARGSVAPRGGGGCLSRWLWDLGGLGGADSCSLHMAETKDKHKGGTLVWDVSPHPRHGWVQGSLEGPFGGEPSPHSDKLPFLISAPSPRRAWREPPNKGLWVPQGTAMAPANERP